MSLEVADWSVGVVIRVVVIMFRYLQFRMDFCQPGGRVLPVRFWFDVFLSGQAEVAKKGEEKSKLICIKKPGNPQVEFQHVARQISF